MTNLAAKLNGYKKSSLAVFARKNSVAIRSSYTKPQIIAAIVTAKQNGTFQDRGF